MAIIDDLINDTPKAGIGLEEAIREFVRLDKQVKEAAADRQWPASIILEHAVNERADQKTVHLETADRKLKVKTEFKTEWQVTDDSEMATVRQLLGDERFFQIFKVKYEPRVKNLKLFLNTGSTDESVQTAKTIIKESVAEVDQRPYISVEKS